MLSIYNSKFIDSDVKIDILNLLKETCKFKYSIYDLIKKHYLIVWLTNSVKKSIDTSTNLSEFFKLTEIYIMIWNQIINNTEKPQNEQGKRLIEYQMQMQKPC